MEQHVIQQKQWPVTMQKIYVILIPQPSLFRKYQWTPKKYYFRGETLSNTQSWFEVKIDFNVCTVKCQNLKVQTPNEWWFGFQHVLILNVRALKFRRNLSEN